jgi:transcriptional regulator with XRE-family HTH domain
MEWSESMFAQRLAELRKEKGLTQDALAALMGMSRPAFSLYEAGKREPDFELLQKLTVYFDVSSDYLLGLTNIRKYYTVIASKFVDQLPEGELKEFVKKYGDEILLDIARKIDNYKLDPQDLADLIDMLGRIQAAKEKK